MLLGRQPGPHPKKPLPPGGCYMWDVICVIIYVLGGRSSECVCCVCCVGSDHYSRGGRLWAVVLQTVTM
jgi:hypothetical protein